MAYLDKIGLTHFWEKIKTALNGKQATLVSGTNIKTINGSSLLGNGNINISGFDMDLLWTNASPTSSFSAQTVSVDLSGYELVYIDFIYAVAYGDSNKNITSVISTKTNARAVICAQGVGDGQNQRKFDVSDSGIYFYGGYASSSNDAVAVPYQIYGIK